MRSRMVGAMQKMKKFMEEMSETNRRLEQVQAGLIQGLGLPSHSPTLVTKKHNFTAGLPEPPIFEISGSSSRQFRLRLQLLLPPPPLLLVIVVIVIVVRVIVVIVIVVIVIVIIVIVILKSVKKNILSNGTVE